MSELLFVAVQPSPFLGLLQEPMAVSSWGCWLTASRRGGWVTLSHPFQVVCSELGPQVQVVVLGNEGS